MIHLTHQLPDSNQFFVACSGGVDSMAAVNWLLEGKRKPYGIIHIHHNTGDYANNAADFVFDFCRQKAIDCYSLKIQGTPPVGVSKEAWWRQKRYEFFNTITTQLGKPYPIVLAHNLDDCVEQYIMSTLIRIKSYPIIGYYGPSNTIRPFRTWSREKILQYAKRKGISWVEDPSNSDTKYVRNKIRHELLPIIKTMNKGIYSHVKSLIINEEY